ncbi:unnamed protein product [Cyprideis torosa]|uniref:Uncharacterized protein n=1 Tax=Cyprideis torosa TaxID=163714 RepID=A0A7R8W949_9CRUS|nr:unnamed protein product [Cyprideis torosa]CAG0888155.1 unnamed protein product [Cyprideis torosa]
MTRCLATAVLLLIVSSFGGTQQIPATDAKSAGSEKYPMIPENYVPSVPQTLDPDHDNSEAKYARETKPSFEGYSPYEYTSSQQGGGSGEVFDPMSFLGQSAYKAADYGGFGGNQGHGGMMDTPIYNSHQGYGGGGGSSSGGKYNNHDFSSSGGGSSFGGHDHKAVYGGGEFYSGGLRPLIKTIGAFLPLGLLLAALPPNVINLTVRRKRSADGVIRTEPEVMYTNPVLEMIEANGLDSLESPNCQRRVLCELAVLGHKPEGNSVQKFLWNVANMVPDLLSSTMGLRDTFRAVRAESCQQFYCPEANVNNRN